MMVGHSECKQQEPQKKENATEQKLSAKGWISTCIFTNIFLSSCVIAKDLQHLAERFHKKEWRDRIAILWRYT